MSNVTFAEQANTFLADSQTRKRSPIRPATYKAYRAAINTHLIPILGALLIQDVGNKQVKSLVTAMSAAGSSAATITVNVNLIKQIVGSVINENGDQLHPRTWNSDFIDLPPIENQKQPTITPELLQQALETADNQNQALWVLLAGSGLRVSEGLALRTGTDDGVNSFWLPAESKLLVRNQRDGDVYGPTKTKAGQREVDLDPRLNDFLKKLLTSIPESGLLFPDNEDKYRQSLGSIPGFHCLRRFRITHLDLQAVPEGIKKFWAGHSGASITDRYTKMGPEIQARKEWAAKAGLGFELPREAK